MEKTYLSFEEVCELLSVSRSTLNQWRKDNRFPSFRRMPNRSLVVHRSEVTAWFDTLEVVA